MDKYELAFLSFSVDSDGHQRLDFKRTVMMGTADPDWRHLLSVYATHTNTRTHTLSHNSNLLILFCYSSHTLDPELFGNGKAEANQMHH